MPLSEFYRDGPLLLVFLRHLGCIFCRQQVAALREKTDWNLAFVCMADPTEAERFKHELRSPHRFVCDPDAALYRAFGLAQGSWGQLLAWDAVVKGLKAFRSGHSAGKPVGDIRQLSGVFLVDVHGEVRWSHASRTSADFPGLEVLRRAWEGT